MTALDTKALLEGTTPEPWFAERRKHCSIVRQSAVRDEYSSRVAECQQWSPAPRLQPTPDEAFANARLIASAPRLARRVIELEEAVAAIRGMIAGYAEQPNLPGDIFKIADAALNGEQTA